MHRAIMVKPLANYFICVRFDNGEDRIYNCFPLLSDGLFSSLKDENYFNTVHIDEMGLVCWDDATDINPYELYENSEPLTDFGFLESTQESVRLFANGRLSEAEIRNLAKSIVNRLDFDNEWQMHKGLGYFAKRAVERYLQDGTDVGTESQHMTLTVKLIDVYDEAFDGGRKEVIEHALSHGMSVQEVKSVLGASQEEIDAIRTEIIQDTQDPER